MPGTSLAAPGNRSFWRLLGVIACVLAAGYISLAYPGTVELRLPVMLEGGFNFLVAVDLEEAEQRERSQEA